MWFFFILGGYVCWQRPLCIVSCTCFELETMIPAQITNQNKRSNKLLFQMKAKPFFPIRLRILYVLDSQKIIIFFKFHFLTIMHLSDETREQRVNVDIMQTSLRQTHFELVTKKKQKIFKAANKCKLETKLKKYCFFSTATRTEIKKNQIA